MRLHTYMQFQLLSAALVSLSAVLVLCAALPADSALYKVLPYVCMYVCMYVMKLFKFQVHVCIIYTHPIYIHTCMYVHLLFKNHIYVIHAYPHANIQYILTYMNTYIHTYLHTYIHTYLLTYIHTYIGIRRGSAGDRLCMYRRSLRILEHLHVPLLQAGAGNGRKWTGGRPGRRSAWRSLLLQYDIYAYMHVHVCNVCMRIRGAICVYLFYLYLTYIHTYIQVKYSGLTSWQGWLPK